MTKRLAETNTTNSRYESGASNWLFDSNLFECACWVCIPSTHKPHQRIRWRHVYDKGRQWTPAHQRCKPETIHHQHKHMYKKHSARSNLGYNVWYLHFQLFPISLMPILLRSHTTTTITHSCNNILMQSSNAFKIPNSCDFVNYQYHIESNNRVTTSYRS